MPSDIKASDLSVDFQPYALRVCSRTSGDVYLDGQLERAVVPKECLWMLDNGTGEEGCLLLLHKMNLELLQKCADNPSILTLFFELHFVHD